MKVSEAFSMSARDPTDMSEDLRDSQLGPEHREAGRSRGKPGTLQGWHAVQAGWQLEHSRA